MPPVEPIVVNPSAPAIRDWTLRLGPRHCRIILGLLLLAGFVGHYRYLTHDCPVDLSGDEAHYWDWSRQLDWSYYSKGPMVAWLIRLSCRFLGDNMPAVRLPALVLAVGTSLLTYWLTLKLFRSDRVALGAVLLNHLVPMFIAGSVIMTIDPPFYFCWAAATALAGKAIIDNCRWPWLFVGPIVGLGFLAKYAMPLWLVGLLLFLATTPQARHHLRCAAFWIGLLLIVPFLAPVLIWNWQHGWVSFHHVARQVGGDSGIGFFARNLLELIGGQLAAIGPLAIIMIASIVHAIRLPRNGNREVIACRYLLFIGLPFLLLVALDSLRVKIQVNWPAPAYFSLIILSAWFLSTRLQTAAAWKPWRPWLLASVVVGIACIPIMHNTEVLYPLARTLAPLLSSKPPNVKWDFSYRLRGWKQLGDRISLELQRLSPDAIVICDDYQVTAQAAFYTRGQPRTFCLGAWPADPRRRSRLSQYDVWPDRRLDSSSLVGRDAVYVGNPPPPEFVAAFDSLERLPDLDIMRRGIRVRTFQLWRGYSFKGMKWPDGQFKF